MDTKMIITAKKLTSELQDIWPDLKDVWPMDRQFWCPSYESLLEGLQKIAIVRGEIKEKLIELGYNIDGSFIDSLHDCDNYALELQADVSRYIRFIVANEKEINQTELLSWAFGTVISMKINNVDRNHTLCICRTSDKGFIFIEPQNFTLWNADKNRDKPYFVEMR